MPSGYERLQNALAEARRQQGQGPKMWWDNPAPWQQNQPDPSVPWYRNPGPQGGPSEAWKTGGRWGYATPNRPYSWQEMSSWADPQRLGGYLMDYADKLGYFGDPRQSALSDYARQQAAQTSGAFQRRMQTAGQVAGLPYGQRGFGYLQGMLGGQGSEAAIINQLLRQQMEEQQSWARNLAAGFAGIPDTRAQTRAYDQQANMGWMGPAGQIAGGFLGSLGKRK